MDEGEGEDEDEGESEDEEESVDKGDIDEAHSDVLCAFSIGIIMSHKTSAIFSSTTSTFSKKRSLGSTPKAKASPHADDGELYAG